MSDHVLLWKYAMLKRAQNKWYDTLMDYIEKYGPSVGIGALIGGAGMGFLPVDSSDDSPEGIYKKRFRNVLLGALLGGSVGGLYKGLKTIKETGSSSSPASQQHVETPKTTSLNPLSAAIVTASSYPNAVSAGVTGSVAAKNYLAGVHTYKSLTERAQAVDKAIHKALAEQLFGVDAPKAYSRYKDIVDASLPSLVTSNVRSGRTAQNLYEVLKAPMSAETVHSFIDALTPEGVRSLLKGNPLLEIYNSQQMTPAVRAHLEALISQRLTDPYGPIAQNLLGRYAGQKAPFTGKLLHRIYAYLNPKAYGPNLSSAEASALASELNALPFSEYIYRKPPVGALGRGAIAKGLRAGVITELLLQLGYPLFLRPFIVGGLPPEVRAAINQ